MFDQTPALSWCRVSLVRQLHYLGVEYLVRHLHYVGVEYLWSDTLVTAKPLQHHLTGYYACWSVLLERVWLVVCFAPCELYQFTATHKHNCFVLIA